MGKIKINSKYKPLWSSDYDYAIVTGGRGSGKSFAVGDFIENLSFEKGHVILFTRYTLTSAHLSVIPEFQEKIDIEGHGKFFKISKTEVENKLTNTKILFRGIKTSSGIQTAALKSIVGLSTWVYEEAEEEASEENFDKIDESVRQKGIKNRVILLLNPASKEHWIYKRFFEQAGVQPGFNGIKDNILYIHTDYRDNKENLSEKFLYKVNQLKLKNPKKYEHRILGGWIDRPDGVIFENWKLGKFDDSLPYGYGLDFGYSIDPDTLIKVAIDKKRSKIYVKELIYQNKQSTRQLINNISKYVSPNELIIADSAEQRLISEIKAARFNIKAAKKGAGSIVNGIKIMEGYEIIVDENSTNIVKELNNYAWSDKKAEIPIDAYNHALDAIRYYCMFILKNKNVFFI